MYLLKHGISHAFQRRAEQKWKKDSEVSFQMRDSWCFYQTRMKAAEVQHLLDLIFSNCYLPCLLFLKLETDINAAK